MPVNSTVPPYHVRIMRTLKAYLQLCRFPALFTALADIMLGFLLPPTSSAPSPKLLLLMGASAGLYLSGMVWNDIFDREQDARERPQRPIPSGRVPLKSAVLFASTLMVVGLGCAAVAGFSSLIVAGMLTACIFLYDWLLKKTPLGPFFMGGCRFLNVILGASTAGIRFASVWGLPQLWVAASLGIYICGVTWFARTEAATSRRSLLLFSAAIVNLGLLGLATWIGGWTIPRGFLIGAGAVKEPGMVLMMLAMIAVSVNRRMLVAIQNPEPAYVQAGVKVMLLSVIMLDATCIYFKLGTPGMQYAAATAFLVIPSLFVGKWMSMT
jgi:4-hydroxybenzoate polyprenyltransferase